MGFIESLIGIVDLLHDDILFYQLVLFLQGLIKDIFMKTFSGWLRG